MDCTTEQNCSRQGASSAPAASGATSGSAGGALVTTAKFAARIREVIDEKTGEIQRFTFDHRRLEFVLETTADEARTARFLLQQKARHLLPNTRTAHCVRTTTNKVSGVGVLKHKVTGKAHYSGLQTCGSPWNCPVCSVKISERRKVEIREAVNTHVAAGGGVEMVTLTVRHGRQDVLATLMDQLRDARSRLVAHRDYKELRKLFQVVGFIRALEVTHGDSNGWHPHFHELWLFPAPLTVRQRQTLQRLLFSAWASASVAAGLPAPSRQRGVHIQQAHSAAEYVAKWGNEPRWDSATELTRANSKRSRSAKGRTPFDLLRAYGEGDSRSGALFAEFAAAFKGFNQCRWSPGLKSLFGIGEISDAEIAALQEEPAEVVTKISVEQWRWLLRQPYEGRAVVLQLAESGGHDAVTRFLAELLRPGRPPARTPDS